MPNLTARKLYEDAKAAETQGKLLYASVQYARLALSFRKQKRPADAKALLKKALSLSPNSARLYLYLALCEVETGEEQRAIQSMWEFAEIGSRKEKLAEHKTYVDSELENHPRLRAAWYEHALNTERTGATYFLGLARAQLDAKDYNGSKDTLLSALKTKSEDGAVARLLKETLSALGQAESTSLVDRFISGELSRDDLLLTLGGPHLKGDKSRLPEPPPLPLDPVAEDLSSLVSALEKELGFPLEERYDKVAPLVREFRAKAEPILRSDPRSRLDIALAYFEMGLHLEAADELRKVDLNDPHYLEAQSLLGEVLRADGSDLDALQVFLSILRDERAKGEVSLAAHYQLIQIYLKLGDRKKALEHVRRLEKDAPSYRDLKRLRGEAEQRGR